MLKSATIHYVSTQFVNTTASTGQAALFLAIKALFQKKGNTNTERLVLDGLRSHS